ncbi:cytochrome C [Olsenella sp. CA-Schmier-601-WT-1]|uniref:Cytochrome C n=1 Tax=Olsenella porci TaxID=2652279 RepID=A0A6N7XQ30_9ACTN|nr:cytochrome C [Olsenella porci]
MKKIKDKQYVEYGQYRKDRDSGHILTPDGLRFMCASHDYDPEAIGRHFLEVL